MDWNAITATVESQLAQQEEALAAEETELGRRRTVLRKRRGALRARRKAFDQCRAIWASIDRSLESNEQGGRTDPPDDDGVATESTLEPLAAGGGR